MNKLVVLSIKYVGWVLALVGTGFIAYTAAEGPKTCPDFLPATCLSFDFMWWTLGLEWFCLAVFGALDIFGGLGRAYVAVTGIFVYASMQMQVLAWGLWDEDMPEKTTDTMYVGYALLFGANLFLVTWTGLEHYVEPKWSDDNALSAVDYEEGAEVRSMAKKQRQGNVLLAIRRWLGLALACVGVAGMTMALVNHAKFCDFACARNWWMYPFQLFAFLVYIITEVILELPSFRPVLTVLLATQIRMFEAFALEASGEGSYYIMEVAGVIIAISISYILFLTLPGPVTTGPSSGLRTLLLGAVPTAAVLVGFIMNIKDVSFTELADSGHTGRWQLAMQLLALVWIIISFVEKVPFLSSFRLPLVAFIANTIHWSAFAYQNVRILILIYDDLSFSDIQIGSLIQSIMYFGSFLLLILVMGTSWERSLGPKSRPNSDLTFPMAARKDGNVDSMRGHEALL